MKFRFIVVLLLLPFGYAGAQVTNVDPYTGQATTVIPLWTLKSGSLAYPIAIFNVSGGIKADAYAGPVGAGWGVSSGFISRTMRGLPDDYKAQVRRLNRDGLLTIPRH
jgi:hypothetical protein